MVLNKLSIRWKITFSNMLLLSVVSLLLYLGSSYSAGRAMEGIPMTQIAPQTEAAADASQTVPAPALTPPLQTAKDSHRSAMKLYMIAAILLGGLAAFAIAKRSLKPLEDFEQCIKDTDLQKLSEKIDFTHTEPEVACLADAFNEMTDKLEQSFLLQKQFSHSVAHELRTPLTVIRTKIEVFQKKKGRSAGEYDQLLDLIQGYTQSLSVMVEDMLQYSNLSDLSLEDDILLDKMLSQVEAEIHALYPNHSLSLNSDRIPYKGNSMLLHRVFSNIMENACRYSPDGSRVGVRITKGESAVVIQISDNGIGIADRDKTHLFEPFFRVDKSRSRTYGGVGLGLFFCREIVNRHGGTVSVCDNQPHGSIFNISLPT